MAANSVFWMRRQIIKYCLVGMSGKVTGDDKTHVDDDFNIGMEGKEA